MAQETCQRLLSPSFVVVGHQHCLWAVSEGVGERTKVQLTCAHVTHLGLAY